jgi:cell division GTPase FtsZ
MRQAEDVCGDARQVDTLITIPNSACSSSTARHAVGPFRMVDDILRQAVAGISDLRPSRGS